MKPVLITGASGFLGSRLIELLKSDQKSYLTLSHKDPKALTKITPAISSVIHLAGLAHRMDRQSEGDLEYYREANVRWPEKVAELAIASGAHRFIYISTVKVNGEYTNEDPFSAGDLPDPHGPYAISKLEGERALFNICRNRMELIVVRPPLIYGPGVKGNLLRLMRLISKGFPLPLGAARGIRSMISATNLSDFLIYLTGIKRRVPESTAGLYDPEMDPLYPVYFPSDIEISTVDLIRLLARNMKSRALLVPVPPIIFRPTGLHERLFRSLSVDSRECRNLGWKNRVTASEALAEMVQSYLSPHAQL